MLTTLLSVTHCAPDLAAVEAAYTTYLNFHVVERSRLSTALAQHWQAPQLAGCASLLLQPESGAAVFLRFVEAPTCGAYEPLRSFGWNATELLVQDPDALAERLAASPFKIIGPPRNLSSNNDIRALQVLGPANELLYLTRLAPGAAGLKLGSAQSFVDRPFIVVVGGATLDSLRQFYAETLGVTVTAPQAVRISVLSRAHGLDAEQLHELALALLPERFAVELDQYPATATKRSVRAGALPPGMALVTFGVASLPDVNLADVNLEDVNLNWLSPPQALAEMPYAGRRAGLLRGAAGELIELVEQA